MAQTDLTNTGLKLTWQFQPTKWPELCEMGLHTGMRDEADWPDLLTYMIDESVRFETYFPETEFKRVSISQWTTAGFVGWHQLASQDVSYLIAEDATPLPHQLALSVQVRNTTDLSIPLGRRRNRTYLGPLVQGIIDGEGRISSALATTIGNDWTALDSDLRAIAPAAIPGAAYAGLCVVSPTNDTLMTGDQFRVGRRFDVHRSRAQQTPESALSVDFP
jgi:hypothetical protein